MFKTGRALLLAVMTLLSTSVFFATTFFGSAVMAQEGHPLVGTWQGDWGATAADRNFLTVIMNWDGKTITGLVNPGPDSSELQTVTLDSSTWSVSIETDVKDDAGQSHHIKAEGKLENIGSQTRTLNGTWEDGQGKGTFTLTRQSGA
jgi:hypothetical protein